MAERDENRRFVGAAVRCREVSRAPSAVRRFVQARLYTLVAGKTQNVSV